MIIAFIEGDSDEMSQKENENKNIEEDIKRENNTKQLDSTNRILEIIKNVKKQAEEAEQEYEQRNEAITRKSKADINLLGGSAVSQVADIAADVRKACDSLFAAYQSLVKYTDEKCRPLLKDNPSAYSIKEVEGLIKYLNEESEIGANFTGSFNGSSLGDLVGVKYFPSIENRQIEQFWKTVFEAMPDKGEAVIEYNENQKKEKSQKRKREREELKQKKERLELYEKLKADEKDNKKKKREKQEKKIIDKEKEWQNKVSEISQKRQEQRAIEEAPIKEKYDSQLNAIDESFQREKAIIESEIEGLKSEIDELRRKFDALGFLSFSKKSEIKNAIKKIEERIDEKKEDLNVKRASFNGKRNNICKSLDGELAKLEETIAERFPMPISPEEEMLQGMSKFERENYYLKKELVEVIRQYGESLPSEIMERGGFDKKGVTYQKQNALLRRLVNEGILSRRERNGKAYFSVAE